MSNENEGKAVKLKRNATVIAEVVIMVIAVLAGTMEAISGDVAHAITWGVVLFSSITILLHDRTERILLRHLEHERNRAELFSEILRVRDRRPPLTPVD